MMTVCDGCVAPRRVRMNVWCLVYVMVLLGIILPFSGATCPNRCLCFRTTVRCMFLQLDKVPRVPAETTILDLRFNRIREIPPGSFKGLTNLNTLLLNNNHLRKIETGAFEGLGQLRYLYLYKNHIRHIDSKAFHGLNKLEQLYVHFNQIEDIEKDTFSKLPALERLFLHNNKLKRLPKGVFTTLSSLRRLRLDSNALICDCQMMWLLEMLKSNHGYTQAAATCEYPSKIQGKSLLSVEMEDFHCRKPKITEGPSDVEVSFGSTTYLSCRAEGDPEPEIIWLHNSHEITSDEKDAKKRVSVRDDGTLMIENTQDSDQGVYECVARNAAGEDKTSPIELKSQNEINSNSINLEPPDTISNLPPTQPEARLPSRPQTHNLQPRPQPQPDALLSSRIHSQVESRPDPRRDTRPDDELPQARQVVETRERVERIVVPERTRDRSRENTRLREIETREARTVPPAVPVVTTDTTVLQGQQLILDCPHSPRRNDIRWTKDDLPLVETIRYSILPAGGLLIANIQYDDRGLYKCHDAYDHSQVSAQVRVTVQVQPTFSERPHDQYAVQGHLVTFTCRAEGHPQPVLRWNIGGHTLPFDGRFTVTPDGRSLTITDVQPEDEGLYVCVAHNMAGERSASAELLVKPREQPEFTRTPSDAERSVGGSVEMFCAAAGATSIRWLKNNAVVIPTDRIFISDEGDLAVYNLTTSDDGLYECQARNVAGLVRSYARLSILVGGVPYVGDPFVEQSVSEAIASVDQAINNTLRDITDPNRRRSPQELLAFFRLPSHEALQITRPAEIYERSLEIISQRVREGHRFNVTQDAVDFHQLVSPSNLAVITRLSGCEAHRRITDCRDMCYHQKYRTYDGTCNNLQHPMWGASLTPLRRMLKSRYENGFNTPVGWDLNRRYNGLYLPSARRVSLHVAAAPQITPDEDYTHMLMQWGQFVDHDMDFVPMAASNARFSDGRHCNETCENQAPCFPIPVGPEDPRIQRHRCIGVTRSSAVCGSGMTSVFFQAMAPREQINQLTSFMDATNVYGSSEHEANLLRDFGTERGLLRTGITSYVGKPLLPANVDAPVDCQMDPNTAHIPCFLAGDHRANEQLGLLSMHTLWMREHNRIAEKLLDYNPHWDGDMLFHEARKIVGAQMQHITYTQWLPKVLGPVGMEMLGTHKGYQPDVNPTIMNAFATAAFRFGHSLINPVIYRFNESMQPIPAGNLPLHKAFFAPFRIVEEGGIDPILRGLFGVAAKKLRPGEFLNSELTERLFQLAHEVGLDLAALNIQRGRDHGLPSYNGFRRHCGLRFAQTFDDFSDEISNYDARRRLQEVYGHPDNVDLWSGGMSEDLVPGARMGRVFMCIISQQFKNIRDGDRFWYENPGVFTPAQLTQIKQATLSRIICDNSDAIDKVPHDVFTITSFPEGYTKCNSPVLSKVDIKIWTHCCHDCSTSGEFNSITSHVFRRRRSVVDQSLPEDKPLSYFNSGKLLQDAAAHGGEELENEVLPGQEEIEIDSDDILKTGKDKQKDIRIAQDRANNLPQKDIQPVVDNIYEIHTKPDRKNFGNDGHNITDPLDTRIEGVESLVLELKRTVHKLTRKLRRIERRYREDKMCVDTGGEIRQDKERWREHDCKICLCEGRQIECTVETCPKPTCKHPRKLAGVCCPVCS